MFHLFLSSFNVSIEEYCALNGFPIIYYKMYVRRHDENNRSVYRFTIIKKTLRISLSYHRYRISN